MPRRSLSPFRLTLATGVLVLAAVSCRQPAVGRAVPVAKAPDEPRPGVTAPVAPRPVAPVVQAGPVVGPEPTGAAVVGAAGSVRGVGPVAEAGVPSGLLSALVEGKDAMPEGEPTPLTSEQIGRLLAQAHRELYGVTPGPDRLLTAWAHVSLEVSRGATCIENNFINVVVSLRWRGSWHVRRVLENVDHDPTRKKYLRTRFRGYATPYEGALDYWRVMTGHFGSAVRLFDQGEARAAGALLCENGFSTGSCESYAQGLSSLYNELRGGWSYRLHSVMQPVAPEPMLNEDWEKLGPVQGQDACLSQSVSPEELMSR